MTMIDIETLENLRWWGNDGYQNYGYIDLVDTSGVDWVGGPTLRVELTTRDLYVDVGGRKVSDGSRIDSTKVPDFFPICILHGILAHLDPYRAYEEIDRYILGRFLKFAFTPDNLKLQIHRDWYNFDELVGAETQLTESFRQKAEAFNKLGTRTERLWFVLELEYGMVPFEIRRYPFWEIKELDASLFEIRGETGTRPASRNRENVVKEYQEYFANFDDENAPICGIYSNGRVKDGHHRSEAWISSGSGHKSVKMLTPAEFDRDAWVVAGDYAEFEGDSSYEFQLLAYETLLEKGKL